jgi:hypothetical protein
MGILDDARKEKKEANARLEAMLEPLRKAHEERERVFEEQMKKSV